MAKAHIFRLSKLFPGSLLKHGDPSVAFSPCFMRIRWTNSLFLSIFEQRPYRPSPQFLQFHAALYEADRLALEEAVQNCVLPDTAPSIRKCVYLAFPGAHHPASSRLNRIRTAFGEILDPNSHYVKATQSRTNSLCSSGDSGRG